AACLEALGHGRAQCLAHSWGAYPALALAAERPELLGRLGRVRKPGKLYGMSTNDATIRHDLTDRQWARLAPLLPPQRPPKGSQGGKPRVDHRRVIHGPR